MAATALAGDRIPANDSDPVLGIHVLTHSPCICRDTWRGNEKRRRRITTRREVRRWTGPQARFDLLTREIRYLGGWLGGLDWTPRLAENPRKGANSHCLLPFPSEPCCNAESILDHLGQQKLGRFGNSGYSGSVAIVSGRPSSHWHLGVVSGVGFGQTTVGL